MTTKRKTHEQLVEELLKVNPKVDVLGRYVNATTKVEVYCKSCRNTWNVTPTNLLRGRGCPNCPSKNQIPLDEFIQRLAEKKPTIVLCGEYKNASTKARFKCLTCGETWYAKPRVVLNYTNCPRCAPNARKSQSLFVSQVKSLNENIEVLGEYLNADTKVAFKCKIDGHEWEAVAASILNGCGCPECGRRKLRSRCDKTHEQFIEELSKINKNVEVVGRYTGSVKKMKMRCLLDGYEWDGIPFNLLKGFGCPKCGDCVKKTHNEFVKELASVKPTLEVLGTYTNTSSRIKVRCKVDGHEWEPSAAAILHASGCPRCAKSGYDQSKTGQFYVYSFGEYMGFGITTSPKRRHLEHNLTFNKYGFDAKLIFAFYGGGHEIKQFESFLKKIIPRVNAGIDGFKTEAILYKDRQILYDAVKSHCGIDF